MNKASTEIKKRMQPLLGLVAKVNPLIEKAEAEGYEVRLSCWGGTLGRKTSTMNVSLVECTKNFAENSKIHDFEPLKKLLEKITKELHSIESDEYCVNIETNHKDGSESLYVESAFLLLFGSDFER